MRHINGVQLIKLDKGTTYINKILTTLTIMDKIREKVDIIESYRYITFGNVFLGTSAMALRLAFKILIPF